MKRSALNHAMAYSTAKQNLTYEIEHDPKEN